MYVLYIVIIFIALFFSTKFLPLTKRQIKALANKRRKGEIKKYFTFETRQFVINKEFKRKMNPAGEMYKVRESLGMFPSIAAALLKAKKHEWLMVAFEKDAHIEHLWVHKGVSAEKLPILSSLDDFVKSARTYGCSSMLILHNHPNIDPHRYLCIFPSDGDISICKEWAEICNENGINFLAFICERGHFYEFMRSISDRFLPLEMFLDEINFQNGKSVFHNFNLHKELFFTKS